MGKIKTLEEYVAENNFLQEAAEFHSKLEKIYRKSSRSNCRRAKKFWSLSKTACRSFNRKSFKLKSSTRQKDFYRASWQGSFCGRKARKKF